MHGCLLFVVWVWVGYGLGLGPWFGSMIWTLVGSELSVGPYHGPTDNSDPSTFLLYILYPTAR